MMQDLLVISWQKAVTSPNVRRTTIEHLSKIRWASVLKNMDVLAWKWQWKKNGTARQLQEEASTEAKNTRLYINLAANHSTHPHPITLPKRYIFAFASWAGSPWHTGATALASLSNLMFIWIQKGQKTYGMSSIKDKCSQFVHPFECQLWKKAISQVCKASLSIM